MLPTNGIPISDKNDDADDKKKSKSDKAERLFKYVFSLAAIRHFRKTSLPNLGAAPSNNIGDNNKKNDDNNRNQTDEVEVIWKKFLQEFTLNGFRYVFQKGVIRRIIWFFILVACFTAVAFSARKSIIKFFNRPITTTVQVVYKDEIVFPAVTLCNFNFFPHYLINGTIGEKVSRNFLGNIL